MRVGEGKGVRQGVLVLLCLSLASVACARDLFVSCEGSTETGDGSEGNPFVFISSAVGAMNEGGTEFVVKIAQGVECAGAENTQDMHIPATVASVTFMSDGNDKPTIECDAEAESGIMFHYGTMGVFSWTAIDVSGCGTLLHGTGVTTRPENMVSLFGSTIAGATDDVLRLIDVEKIDIQHCSFRDVSGMIVQAHALESGDDAYVSLYSSHLQQTGGFFLNGYMNVNCSNNELDHVDTPFSITAEGGDWNFWGSSFTDCNSAYGGAINAVGTHWNTTASLLVVNSCSFSRCSAKRGGAIYANGGKLHVYESHFDSCSATFGAAIAVGAIQGEVSLDCTNNVAEELGGCLYLNQASTIVLGEATVTGNTAGVAGAAFACSGPDNELILPEDADDLSLDDNKPKSFENACVDEYYDEATWASDHWIVLVAAILGVFIVGVVLVTFVCFEVYKYIKQKRSEAAEFEGEELSSDIESDSDAVAVEYDFSQPAATVANDDQSV